MCVLLFGWVTCNMFFLSGCIYLFDSCTRIKQYDVTNMVLLSLFVMCFLFQLCRLVLRYLINNMQQQSVENPSTEETSLSLSIPRGGDQTYCHVQASNQRFCWYAFPIQKLDSQSCHSSFQRPNLQNFLSNQLKSILNLSTTIF